jgi:predicted dehydrogenase
MPPLYAGPYDRGMTRVGVVGYGMAGRGIHTPLLQAAGCEVVAVVTANERRVAQARADLPGVTVVPTLEALLEVAPRLRLDLVVLATPTGGHAAEALSVIRAGLPLVVDKPLGVDAATAAEVVRAARGRVPLSVFQNKRYDPDVLTLGGLLRDGGLGEVRRAEARWERWRVDGDHEWRDTLPADQGGGVLLDLHSHLVDAVVRLFGPVGGVYAELAARDTVAEDEAFLSCRHVSGVVSHLGVSARAAAYGPRWRVLGSEGSYLVSGLVGEPGVITELADVAGHCGWFYRGPGERAPVPAVGGSPVDYYRGVAAALALGDVRDVQAALPVDPADSVHVLAVLDAARRSAGRGEVVAPATTPLD